MGMKCLECDCKITLGNALCEDWRDADRSYGCPQCGVFYRRDRSPKLMKGLQAGIAVFGVGVPLQILVQQSVSAGLPIPHLLIASIVVTVLVILALPELSASRKLVRSGYRVGRVGEVGTDAGDAG